MLVADTRPYGSYFMSYTNDSPTPSVLPRHSSRIFQDLEASWNNIVLSMISGIPGAAIIRLAKFATSHLALTTWWTMRRRAETLLVYLYGFYEAMHYSLQPCRIILACFRPFIVRYWDYCSLADHRPGILRYG
ncbi:hypothetical protein C8J56DRAFT_1025936 [Mycena floridula]|nr:hypothetical protein C8J56DRAFT_1025936 [Mycena floridula]